MHYRLPILHNCKTTFYKEDSLVNLVTGKCQIGKDLYKTEKHILIKENRTFFFLGFDVVI